jgi:hypothetical protein
MSVERIYGHLSCTDLERSRAWFTILFGRAPDAAPMAGLLEWHHRDAGGLQLFEDAANAGRGTLTLIINGLSAEHDRLAAGGIQPGPIEAASTTSNVLLRDPDDNLVVLAEPLRG